MRRWSAQRKLGPCLSIGQTLSSCPVLCKYRPLHTAMPLLIYISHSDARLKTDTKNQTDDFIHLDLAGDIFKALLQRDFDSA